MVKITDSGHQSFTFVSFCWLLAENFKKSAEKKTYEVFITGVSIFSDHPVFVYAKKAFRLSIHVLTQGVNIGRDYNYKSLRRVRLFVIKQTTTSFQALRTYVHQFLNNLS